MRAIRVIAMSDLVTWLRTQLDEDQWHAEEQHRSRGAHIEFHTSRGRTTRRCIDPDRHKHKMPCPTIRLLAESHREEWAP